MRRGRRRCATAAPHRVAALLLALLLAGCEFALTRTAPFGTVRVQANARSGVPLPGIDVKLYTGRRPMGYTRTDANGHAVFRDVPPGEYGVLMELPEGYADLSEISAVPPDVQRDGIAMVAGRDTTLQFTFARRGLGAIEAEVHDSAGLGIPGITVTFYRSSGVIASRVTDSLGFARADSVPIGQYGAFLQPPDSLGVPGAAFQFRDGLIVEREVRASAQFTLATCRGSIAVHVRDQLNAGIAGIDVLRYAATGNNRTRTTDAGGNTTFANVPCGEHGVALQPLAGFTVSFVRDSGYVDGVVITRGSALSATLRATRN